MTTLVVGIGNTILGDDGVGVHAVRRLRERPLPDGVVVEEVGIAGLGLLDLAAGHDRLIVIDAICTGAAPGTVHLLKGDEVPTAAHLGAGHEADLPQSIEIGRRLLQERMPQEIVVVAIEALDIQTFSESLTPEVEAAIPEAVKLVVACFKT